MKTNSKGIPLHYDVIVVGAGPAGGMAARILSQKNHRVCLLDKKREVGRPVLCGEAVSRFALETNGLSIQDEWVKGVARGIKMRCPNGKYFYATKNPQLSLIRDRFDQWLVQQAVDNGAHVRLNSAVVGVDKDSPGWRVETNRGVFRSEILIAADGPSSQIARWTGLLKRREYLKALQFTFAAGRGERFKDESLCVYKRAEYNPGYIWIFPRGDEYNVGIGGCRSLLSTLLPFCESKGFDVNKKKRVSAGIIPRRYELEAYTRDGLMVVGDAAGLTNPIHGGGIYQALISGRLAADAAHQALIEGSLSFLSVYEERIRQHAILDPRLYRASRIMATWDNGHFSLAGTLFEGETLSTLPLSDALRQVVKHPRYFLKIPEFLEAKRAFELIKDGW